MSWSRAIKVELLSNSKKGAIPKCYLKLGWELHLNYRSDYGESPLHTHLMPCRMQYPPPAAAQRHPEVQWHHKNHHKVEKAEILLNIDLPITAEELRSLELQISIVYKKPNNSKVTICHFKLFLLARFRVTEALFDKHSSHQGFCAPSPALYKTSALLCHYRIQN